MNTTCKGPEAESAEGPGVTEEGSKPEGSVVQGAGGGETARVQ